MHKNIYNFPLASCYPFNFVKEITLTQEFMINELDAIEKKDVINKSYWNLINNIFIDSNNIVESDEDIEEEFMDLFEDISNEDIDEQLEEYKGKKDLVIIKDVIEFIQNIKVSSIYHIMDCVYNNQFIKKDLILSNRNINKSLKYILEEYPVLLKGLKNDNELKELLLIENKSPKESTNIITNFIFYFNELELQIGGYNQIKDDIISAVIKSKNGDKEAKDFIIGEIIQKEARKMAIKYSIRNGMKDQELYDDLLQEAIVSSINGLNKYNYKKNDNFIYYIRFWIRQGIHKGLENQYNEIKIPSHIIQLFGKIKNLHNNGESIELEIEEIVNELKKQHIEKLDKKLVELKKQLKQRKGRSADKIQLEINTLLEFKIDDEFTDGIRKKVKNTIEKINSNSVSSIGSLLRNIDDDDDGSGIESNILIDENADVENQLRIKEHSAEIKKLLDVVLTEEEKTVIIHRFGLFGADVLLLETLGKKINKSAERVRQVFKNAKNKLSIRSFDELTLGLSSNKKLVENKTNKR